MAKLFIVVFVFLSVVNLHAQSHKISLGDSLLAHGNYSKAIEAYLQVPQQDLVSGKLAKAYVSTGQLDKGLKYYDMAVSAKTEDHLLAYEYGKLLVRKKNYTKAIAVFENLVKVDATNPNYHYQIGTALEKMGDSAYYKRYLKVYNLDPNHQKALFKLGKYHLKKRHYTTSLAYIEKGLKSYPNNTQLISLKAQNYYYQEYYDKAITWFEALLDLGERSEFIHEKLSIAFAKEGFYKNAIEQRLKVLNYNPYDATSMYVIGDLYQQLEQYEKAEEYISKSLKLQDRSLNHEYRTLGKVYNRQKKYDKAIKAFQKALKEDPSDYFAQYFILKTKDEYYADKKVVIKLYENYIASNPKSPFLSYAKKRLQELNEEVFMTDAKN